MKKADRVLNRYLKKIRLEHEADYIKFKKEMDRLFEREKYFERIRLENELGWLRHILAREELLEDAEDYTFKFERFEEKRK